jgi:hypothetical protein
MTTSNTHICAAQDAYTRQFHATTMEDYRNIYEGRNGEHQTGHCGVLDKRRKAAVLFIENGQIEREEFENFVAFCTHKFKQPPTSVARLTKPSRAKSVEMIQEMLDQFMSKLQGDIKKYNEELDQKQRGREDGEAYGELGYDEFVDEEGNDTWGGATGSD